MLFHRPPPRLRAPALAHGQLVEVAGHPVRLRVSPRARRIALRLDAARREVALSAPSARRLPEALAFAESRAGWIAARLAELPARQPLVPGALIELAGAPCRLERSAMRVRGTVKPATADEPARLIASGEGEAYARAVVRALRAEALARLTERTAVHCAALRVAAPAVALQDARTRWGSCRGEGGGAAAAIRYNWRLVMAPAAVLDYVAAHECAHLVEGHHGPAFWSLVRRLYGDPEPARTWLKVHGAALHAAGT